MNKNVGNLEVFITKDADASSCGFDNVKVKLNLLNRYSYEKVSTSKIGPQHIVKLENIPLGHYDIEVSCQGYFTENDYAHVKFPGPDTHWQGHFRKSRNSINLSIKKNTSLNNILVVGKSVPEEVDLTVKGVGAGWTGAEITLKGRTALKLSGENFFVTGRPQPGMWVPNTGSTSSLLIYKAANPNKVFRLDYHALNSTGGRPAWHYNTTRGFAQIKGLKATNHAVTPGAAAIGRTLTIFRWGGRAMFVVGAGMSAFDVYYAENKAREVTRQVGGWTGAVVGGKYGAKGGAKVGAAIAAFAGQAGPQVATPEEIVTIPAGVIIGSIVGAIGGGVVGWIAGTKTTETTFDWIFQPLDKEEWIIH